MNCYKNILFSFLFMSVSMLMAQEKPHDFKTHIHRHNFEAFVGGTSHFLDHALPLITIGLDYEHRFHGFHEHLGAGILIDYEFENQYHEQELLITPTLVYFITKHHKAFVGAGIAQIDHEILFLCRTGIGYEIDVTPSFILSPTISLDVTKEYTAGVLGVAFGFGI